MKTIYEKIAEAERCKLNFALCIVVSTHGSTPREAGAKMMVYENGSIYGTVGGGSLEKKVIQNALEVLRHKGPRLFKHDLLHQHGMCCGGTVEIYIEPVMSIKRLYIFGAGHTGQALAGYAPDFGFETVLIDDRKEYIEECKHQEVSKMNLPFGQALQVLPFDWQTYIVILTYSHETDRDILAFCLKKPHAYLGMIGSKRKVEITKKIFTEAGVASLEELNKVDMPIGMEIHAETPGEIALSILAKLIFTKNT